MSTPSSRLAIGLFLLAIPAAILVWPEKNPAITHVPPDAMFDQAIKHYQRFEEIAQSIPVSDLRSHLAHHAQEIATGLGSLPASDKERRRLGLQRLMGLYGSLGDFDSAREVSRQLAFSSVADEDPGLKIRSALNYFCCTGHVATNSGLQSKEILDELPQFATTIDQATATGHTELLNSAIREFTAGATTALAGDLAPLISTITDTLHRHADTISPQVSGEVLEEIGNASLSRGNLAPVRSLLNDLKAVDITRHDALISTALASNAINSQDELWTKARDRVWEVVSTPDGAGTSGWSSHLAYQVALHFGQQDQFSSAEQRDGAKVVLQILPFLLDNKVIHDLVGDDSHRQVETKAEFYLWGVGASDALGQITLGDDWAAKLMVEFPDSSQARLAESRIRQIRGAQ